MKFAGLVKCLHAKAGSIETIIVVMLLTLTTTSLVAFTALSKRDLTPLLKSQFPYIPITQPALSNQIKSNQIRMN